MTVMLEKPKKLSERCIMFIRGQQCDNYRSLGSYCAMHGKGTHK